MEKDFRKERRVDDWKKKKRRHSKTSKSKEERGNHAYQRRKRTQQRSDQGQVGVGLVDLRKCKRGKLSFGEETAYIRAT